MGSRKWTKEEHDYIMANYATGDRDEMAKHLNRTKGAITIYANAHGIVKENRKTRFWTPEKDDLMRRLYHNTRSAEIGEMIGATRKAVIARAFELGLKKDKGFMFECCKGTCFQKGHVSFNKGMHLSDYIPPKSLEKIRKTQFKKGHIPHNHREVGAERVTADGYIEVKVAEPNVFIFKHRWIWEQAHGPIPPKHLVVFKDGNKRNFDLENLELVSMKDHVLRVGLHKYPKEVRDLIHLRSILTRTINYKERNDRNRQVHGSDVRCNRSVEE